MSIFVYSKRILFCLIELVLSSVVFKKAKDVYYKRQHNIVELWFRCLNLEKRSLISHAIDIGIDYALGTKHNNKYIRGYDYFSLYVGAQTILIILSVISVNHLCFIFVFKIAKKTFPTKASSIVAPKKFNGNVNVVEYLDMFDLYLVEEHIEEDKNKCNALLSRLELNCLTMVKNYSDDSMRSYDRLKEVLLRLYGISKETRLQSQSKFLERNQANLENIHQYYAVLRKLSYLAYNSITPKQRLAEVGERFIYGLRQEYEQVRSKLIKKFLKNKVDWSKITTITIELIGIYGQSSL